MIDGHTWSHSPRTRILSQLGLNLLRTRVSDVDLLVPIKEARAAYKESIAARLNRKLRVTIFIRLCLHPNLCRPANKRNVCTWNQCTCNVGHLNGERYITSSLRA